MFTSHEVVKPYSISPSIFHCFVMIMKTATWSLGSLMKLIVITARMPQLQSRVSKHVGTDFKVKRMVDPGDHCRIVTMVACALQQRTTRNTSYEIVSL
ncbi:hypothetical protein DPMN_096373 [Dreissena polymorpha]|uniref:Uncharacterized protein n=1 Tax=Dreissena polymorpha TaxID=45954 RepID=A0A9D4L8L1_DREPO|nr:hypothetical protein DPMN_096373 [Dreissena polymorpha]